MLSMIAAIAANGVIGQANRLPWRLPADLEHFRAKTLGKPVVMGCNTWYSIGKPLPERRNIVLSTDRTLVIDGCEVVHEAAEVLTLAAEVPELMIIGGESVYRLFLPHAERMYLTLIHHPFEGDTYFPPFDQDDWWEEERLDQTAEVTYLPHSFVTLRRKVSERSA